MTHDKNRPVVVIVGAGFGGLWAAKALASSDADVLVVDRNNYHTFFPLLHQISAAELEPENIAYPVRRVLRKARNVSVTMAAVTGVDLDERCVDGIGRRVSYDYLIIETGSVPSYFGVSGAAETTFPLRTLEDGVAFRNHILSLLERAEVEPDPATRRRLLTFATVGGGPTGVEFAGALTELVHGPIAREFRRLDVREVSIMVIEAAGALLAHLPPKLRDYTLRRLRKMHVETRLDTRVERIEREAVHLDGGETIESETIVWTAGVGGGSLAEEWGLPAGPGGRIAVTPTLQVEGHPELYAIGDAAAVQDTPLPMVAPVATQQGTHAARNIVRQLRGAPPVPFKYRDLGTMAVVGRSSAVALLWGRGFTGIPAWLLWLAVHLFELIGFRNRLMVLTGWAWDYLFLDRVVRLILPATRDSTTK